MKTPDTQPSLGSVDFQITERFLLQVEKWHKHPKFLVREILTRLISLVVASIFAIFDTIYHLLFVLGKGLACLGYKLTDKPSLSEKYSNEAKQHLSLVCLSILYIAAAPIIGFCNPGMLNLLDENNRI